MNKLTKVLISVPFLLGSVACGAEDRIVTGPNPVWENGPEISINCTQKTILEDGEWKSRDDYPGFENLTDLVIDNVCG